MDGGHPLPPPPGRRLAGVPVPAEPPPHPGAVRRAARADRPGNSGLAELAALVFADEALAARLAAIAEGPAFAEAAMGFAGSRGLALTEADLHGAARPDPLGLSRRLPSALGGPTLPPRRWLPAALSMTANGLVVDWIYFGAAALREGFYEDSLRRALSLPFNRVFHYRTALDDLIAQVTAVDSLEPNGFIFHMSRCGSTLVAQMLAALDDSIVISEAPPLDGALQYGRSADEATAIAALRAMVLALGRRRAGGERRYIIKLDCWHTLALPIFRRAFPHVPWLFLYRDPVEVLVSQIRQRGMQMVPQFFPPAFFGFGADEATPAEDYCAQVLAAVCCAALDHHTLGGGLFLNYRHLPGAAFTAALPHFGLTCSDDERERMRQAAASDAKVPGLPFVADAEPKQRAATDAIRAAACHLGEIYAGLEKFATPGAID